MERITEPTTVYLDAHGLQRILAHGRMAIEARVEDINALNVFPVPDGDTGINMFLTMKALEDSPSTRSATSASAMLSALSDAALRGSRGNSGVILAQFLRGLASGLEGKEQWDGSDLASALGEACTAAYGAVARPVEGTMLTVIRELAEAAQQVAGNGGDVLATWEAACLASRESVARTPTLLPVLREAGVVDAGGLGLSVIMEGALAGLRGVEPALIEFPAPVLDSVSTSAQAVSAAFVDATEEEIYGYCTQFVIEGESLSPDAVRAALEPLAASTVVIGGGSVVRVHVHAEDPGPAISCGASLGTLAQVSIENMDEQHRRFVADRRQEQQLRPVAVVAVASGEGLTELFLDSGAGRVLSGGDTMNPSTQEILDAVEDAGAERVILLPNNTNIVSAAEQARSLSSREVAVVPTASIPQGVAALLAFNEVEEFEANVSAMSGAFEGVVSGAVGPAQRDAELGGVRVSAGQFMGLLERRMVTSGDDASTVLTELVGIAEAEPGSIVTLYWGAATEEDEAEAAADVLREQFPDVDVEVVFGGQPHYNYIVSVE
ncbi:MAG: DAK2 domain-containing protein [Chloroflexota bacterium]|nr:DAK2 domain-containing protein [Chloroflexota bacterium]MDE2942425.1 DAK2 domain-containing protein [Chloroflexota bacterium]MDE3267895.1 DAK2 domain-containing protein [Chloroflexota bacterium]